MNFDHLPGRQHFDHLGNQYLLYSLTYLSNTHNQQASPSRSIILGPAERRAECPNFEWIEFGVCWPASVASRTNARIANGACWSDEMIAR